MHDGPVNSQELNPYARYYPTELLPRASSHDDDYTTSAIRYAPRYCIDIENPPPLKLKILNNNTLLTEELISHVKSLYLF